MPFFNDKILSKIVAWNEIVFLAVIAAISVISATLCAPALPLIADHFSAGASLVQFTMALFLAGGGIGQLISGPLSDLLGARTVLFSGLFLYVMACCGCALADRMDVLIGARFFQGMGSSVGPVLARAIACSRFSSERSAQVQSYGAMSLGMISIIAILCSGGLSLVSWRGNFWLAASLGALLLLWAYKALDRSLIRSGQITFGKIFTQMQLVVKNRHFLQAAFSHCITYGLMYSYIALFPFLIMHYLHEKNPMQLSIYSVYMLVVYMLGAFLASSLVPRYSLRRVVGGGLFLQLVSGVMLALTPPFWVFMTALTIFNLSIGIVLPLTSAAALAPFAEKGVGTASSAFGVSYRLMGALLNVLICQLPLAGGRSLGVAIFFLSLVALLTNKGLRGSCKTQVL